MFPFRNLVHCRSSPGHRGHQIHQVADLYCTAGALFPNCKVAAHAQGIWLVCRFGTLAVDLVIILVHFTAVHMHFIILAVSMSAPLGARIGSSACAVHPHNT
jgi:hypothetical protein